MLKISKAAALNGMLFSHFQLSRKLPMLGSIDV